MSAAHVVLSTVYTKSRRQNLSNIILSPYG